MININTFETVEEWTAKIHEAEHWHQVDVLHEIYDEQGQELVAWLNDSDFPGYYALGMHPKWDDYMQVSIQDANAAFAFKMVYGGGK